MMTGPTTRMMIAEVSDGQEGRDNTRATQMRAGDGLHSPSPNIVCLFLEIALYLLTKHFHLQATTGRHNSQPHTCHSNRAWTLDFVGGSSGGSKRMTTTIPEIERLCSISRVVVVKAKGKPTTPKIEHRCSISGVADFLLLLPASPPPKLSTNTRLRVVVGFLLPLPPWTILHHTQNRARTLAQFWVWWASSDLSPVLLPPLLVAIQHLLLSFPLPLCFEPLFLSHMYATSCINHSANIITTWIVFIVGNLNTGNSKLSGVYSKVGLLHSNICHLCSPP